MKKYIKIETVDDFSLLLNTDYIVRIKEVIENSTTKVFFADGTNEHIQMSFSDVESFLNNYGEGILTVEGSE